MYAKKKKRILYVSNIHIYIYIYIYSIIFIHHHVLKKDASNSGALVFPELPKFHFSFQCQQGQRLKGPSHSFVYHGKARWITKGNKDKRNGRQKKVDKNRWQQQKKQLLPNMWQKKRLIVIVPTIYRLITGLSIARQPWHFAKLSCSKKVCHSMCMSSAVAFAKGCARCLR